MHKALTRDVPLASLTSLGIGGPADFLYYARDGEEVLAIAALGDNLPVTVLGHGTNVLIHDDGVEGLVIRLYEPVPDVVATQNPDGFFVSVPAGMPLSELVFRCVWRGWQGIECLSGIPGTVGGAVVQSAGAYGQEISDVFHSATVVDTSKLEATMWQKLAMDFGYRDSALKGAAETVITEVTLRLNPGTPPCRSHPDVLAGTRETSGLQEVSAAVINARKSKGMLSGQHFSAGSFFRNHKATPRDMDCLLHAFGDLDREKWSRKLDDKYHRVSTAKLMEAVGFRKGYQRGKAGLSPDHVMALVNLGGAGHQDILDLAKEIRNKVYDEFDIELQPEVQFLGFNTDDPIGH